MLILRLRLCLIFPLSVPQSELMQEQVCDSSLKELFDHVLSAAKINNAASGHFLDNELLFRKWVVLDSDCVGDAVFELVVLNKFRPLVLKVAHDESGHFGVRKTYLNILKYFFWPHVKTDVATYTKTCHVCLLTGKPNQCVKSAPLQPIPAVSKTLEYLIVGCVGLCHALNVAVSTY